MKIAFLLQDTGNVYGAERATLDLAEGLHAERDADCTLLLIEETRLNLERSRLREQAEERDLAVETLPASGPFSWALIRDVRKKLPRIDLLHTVGYKANVHALLARGRRTRPPIVASVHGWLFRPDTKELLYGWVDQKALRHCDRVVALSRFYVNLLRQSGVPGERIVRIPSGLRVGSVAPPTEEPARAEVPLVVGMMGRLSWEKNHGLLLRAVATMKQAGVPVRVRIAGEGPDGPALAARIAEAGLEDLVQLEGYVEGRRFLAGLDVLVMCSTMENLPYSVLEAMAARLPVVATNVGGLPDLIEDGRTGYLVSPQDAETLAERLCLLARKPARRRAMGRAARAVVEDTFTLDATVRQHLSLYRQLVRGQAS